MRIEHDFIWSTTYCVPACMCTQYCIIRTRHLSTGISPVSVSVQFMSCAPGVNQGARGLLPTVCAYSFSVCRFRLVRYVLPVYVGLGSKLHACILFIVYVHYMFMNATSYIRFYSQHQLNQVFNFSIKSASLFQYRYSSIQLQYSFLAYYLLSFVAHLVLFTIPGISGGVLDVGTSSSGLQCVYMELLKTKDVWKRVRYQFRFIFHFQLRVLSSIQQFILRDFIFSYIISEF